MLSLLLGVLMVALGGSHLHANDVDTSPPNILLLLADDQGMQLGCLGTPGIETPHLDGLAHDGMLFRNAFASCASCSPSRSSILTGMYPHANGHWRNTHAPALSEPEEAFTRDAELRDWVGVHDHIPTLPEIFREAGYFTGITQKFHLSPPWKYPFDVRERGGRTREATFESVRRFFEQCPEKPFFLMVNIGNTHRPFRPSEGKFAVDPSTMEVPASMPDTPALRKDFAAYLETVQQVDACIGGAIEALRQSGRFERTYLFYTSDHGYPYLRAKASVYEEGIHVPLIITGPDIEADRSTPELVSLIDLAPTMLEIADLPVPETVQGSSLLPLLRRETETLGRKLIFAEHNAHGPGEIYPSRAVTDGRLIYLLNLMPEKRYKPPADLLPGKKWNNRAYPAYLAARDLFPLQFEALQKTLVRPEEELYDLHSDPGSLVNRVEDPRYRKHVARLRQALRQWRNHTSDVDDPGEIPTIEK